MVRKRSLGSPDKRKSQETPCRSGSALPGVSLCEAAPGAVASPQGAHRPGEPPGAGDVTELAYRPWIVIKGPHAFVTETAAHLASIAGLRLGRELLASLERSGRRVTILPTARMSEAPPEDFRGALARGRALRWVDEWGRERAVRGRGAGSDTTIKYNPALTTFGVEPWQRQPPEIGLAHELIHADDAAHGRMDPEQTDGVRNYELQAIGLGPYRDKKFTENKFRDAWPDAQPLRPRY